MSKDLFTHLILKSFQQTLTGEELEMLEAWLKEDASHRELFDKLESSWKQAEGYKEDFHVDLDKGWQSIQSRIGKVNTAPRIIPFWQQPAIRIAASLVLLIGIAWAAINYFGNGFGADQYISYVTMDDEVKEISLPDGSTVWLNEQSRLSFPKDFNQRDVELNGEAQFEVEHDPDHPFTVTAAGTQTTVLGTTFNVDANDDNVRVSLINGRVAFTAPENDALMLAPGETASYDAAKNLLTKEVHKTQNFNSWKTGTIVFAQKPIEEVVADLENYLDLEIDLVNDSDQPCLFTGTFKEPSYEEILEVLSFTFDLHHSELDGRSHLVINNCQ